LGTYRSKALVGSLWPRDPTLLIPEILEGACKGMPLRWRNWLRPQHRWELQQEHPLLAARQHAAVKPRALLSEDFPDICEGGRAPVGHGGLSLRSRKWMIQAIETCPQKIHSGMKVDEDSFACKVFEAVSDDLYFGLVFAGMGAPLPIAFDASLFATQMLWPEQVWESYGFPTGGSESRSSWNAKRPTIRVDGDEITIPNALFHPSELLRSELMTNACPYLPYTFQDDLSKPEETERETQEWVGIGN